MSQKNTMKQLELFSIDDWQSDFDPDLPALLQPIYQKWNSYDEGSIEDIYNRM